MLRSRYRRITFYFARVIASLFWWDILLFNLGFKRWARRTRHERLRRIAVSYRKLAIEMGGVLIKAGQFLSARVDVLPEVVTNELTGLQDEVPPEDFDEIRRMAEAELGGPLSQYFEFFETEPMAAASLGQVHRALLKANPEPGADSANSEGEPTFKGRVVVKIQRPRIEQIIQTDIAALRTVGRWIRRYKPISRRANVPALLGEFERILYEEIDYLAEGRNAETFGVNFANRPDVCVPRVFWPQTTRRVLTLEDVFAIKITDYDAISAAGVARGEVARRLFDVYMEQIFKHEIFHADPHPGNLFVCPAEDGNWQLTFVDFGMVGRVPPKMRAGLREGVIGAGMQDTARLLRAYQLLGVLLPQADTGLIEKIDQALFDRFGGKSMGELSQIDHAEIRELANEFRELIYDMPFQLPEDLILLGRCVAILSGMCTGLNPDFNVWDAIAPVTKELIAEETVGGWEFWRDEAVDLLKTGLVLPKRLERTLALIEKGQMQVRVPELSDHLRRLEVGLARLMAALVFSALLMGGIQVYLAGEMRLGGVLLGGAALALLWAFLRRPRRR